MPPTITSTNMDLARYGIFPSLTTAPSLLPFLEGELGQSPATLAAIEAFKRQALPIVQQEAQLAGLGRSGALLDAEGYALSQALPPLYQQEAQNRLAAQGLADTARFRGIEGLQGEERLNLATGQQAADIAGAEANRQLQANQSTGNLLLGYGNLLSGLSGLESGQQQQALAGFTEGGQLQRDVTQEGLDAAELERLRLQGLSEEVSVGLFGGQAIPPVIASKATQTTSGGGGSSK